MTEENSPVTTGQEYKNTVTPSEARIILGPLVKYALMGLVLAAVLLTTVVMLDHRITDINREVAALEAELVAANNNSDTLTADKTIPTVDQTSLHQSDATEVIDAPQQQRSPQEETATLASQTPSRSDVIAHLEEANNATVPAPPESDETVAHAQENTLVTTTTVPQSVESAIDTNTTETASQAASRRSHIVESHPVVMINQNERQLPFGQTLEAIIAESNAYLKHRDDIYLEDYKASQEKQIQFMRDRLARQEQRIKDLEALYRQKYDLRADNLKELQKIRESFVPDRI